MKKIYSDEMIKTVMEERQAGLTRIEDYLKGRAYSMNVLIACEESQRVCTEFRKLGHNAFSCDIIPCSGGHPEWHIMQDVIPLLNGNCEFTTMDGQAHKIAGKWD